MPPQHDIAVPGLFGAISLRELLQLQKAAPVPAGFQGRVGVLVAEGVSHSPFYAFDPWLALGSSWTDITQTSLWPFREEKDVPDLILMNGKGEKASLLLRLRTHFAQYPNRPELQGGRELDLKKGFWRQAFVAALTNPSVKLLKDFNRHYTGSRPRALFEWWVGPSPAHAIRHDGAFYRPVSSANPLLDWLATGLDAEGTRPCWPEGTDIDLPILYEDDDVICIDKPAHLASVPGVWETRSAKTELEKRFGKLHVVHRLDTDTSGVLLFAKNERALRTLNATFREGLALKRYRARISGVPTLSSGTIELPLTSDLTDRPRQCVLATIESGKPSKTDYEVVRTDVDYSVVDLYPATGRTHQLRVHCAHLAGLGCPILGDAFYGPEGVLADLPGKRLWLHAAELTLPHPAKKTVLHVEADDSFF